MTEHKFDGDVPSTYKICEDLKCAGNDKGNGVQNSNISGQVNCNQKNSVSLSNVDSKALSFKFTVTINK